MQGSEAVEVIKDLLEHTTFPMTAGETCRCSWDDAHAADCEWLIATTRARLFLEREGDDSLMAEVVSLRAEVVSLRQDICDECGHDSGWLKGVPGYVCRCGIRKAGA